MGTGLDEVVDEWLRCVVAVLCWFTCWRNRSNCFSAQRNVELSPLMLCNLFAISPLTSSPISHRRNVSIASIKHRQGRLCVGL